MFVRFYLNVARLQIAALVFMLLDAFCLCFLAFSFGILSPNFSDATRFL